MTKKDFIKLSILLFLVNFIFLAFLFFYIKSKGFKDTKKISFTNTVSDFVKYNDVKIEKIKQVNTKTDYTIKSLEEKIAGLSALILSAKQTGDKDKVISLQDTKITNQETQIGQLKFRVLNTDSINSYLEQNVRILKIDNQQATEENKALVQKNKKLKSGLKFAIFAGAASTVYVALKKFK